MFHPNDMHIFRHRKKNTPAKFQNDTGKIAGGGVHKITSVSMLR